MNRRQLLQSMGLGMGAAFLSPWLERTLSYAMGQSATPRRRVIVFAVNAFEPGEFTPVEISTGRTQGKGSLPTPVGPMTDFTWPAMFLPIEDLRDDTLLIDGLTNPIEGGDTHGCGYGALTCQHPQGEAVKLAPPRGSSIDQYLARTLSANSPKSSLLFGTSYSAFAKDLDRETSLFSAGTGQPLAHTTKASVLYDEIVELASPNSSGVTERNRRQALRDALQTDFARLRGRLAGPERERLDVYETAIAEFDRRYELRENVSCDGVPVARDGSETTRMESMMDMATLSLACGLTNVVGVAVGTATSHDAHLPRYDGIGTIPVHDYGTTRYADRMTEVHQFHWTILRKTLDALAQSDASDDETFILYVSPRGTSMNDSHHGRQDRWPVMMLARSPNLQLGGRFLRYAPRERSFAEFCQSLCQVVGVCPDGFGTGSHVAGPVQGLLDEVVGSTQPSCR